MKCSKLLLASFLTPILCLCIMQTAFAQTEKLGSVKYTPPMPDAKGVRKFGTTSWCKFFYRLRWFSLGFDHRLLSANPPG